MICISEWHGNGNGNLTFSSSSCLFNKSSNKLSSISNCTRSFSTSAVTNNHRTYVRLDGHVTFGSFVSETLD